MTQNGRNLQSLTGTWDQDKGGKRGDERTRETAEDAGTRRRAQSQLEEAG